MATLKTKVVRAFLEIGFILFLFYANLLMGEFSRSIHRGFPAALRDAVTPENFAFGVGAAIIGYTGIEFFRRKV